MLDLPDAQTRFELIKSLLEKNGVGTVTVNQMRCVPFIRELGTCACVPCRQMANETSGYSSADLVECLRETAMIPIRDLKSRDRIATLRPEQLRPISYQDIEIALATVKPSASEEHMKAMKLFAERCGTVA
jgi:SpoVK/Ycf46/Vps4 family AAA+-type ATPase